jgi:putative peptide zinc metalloprotease protein
MNLAEALNAALPDLPGPRRRTGYPKLDPALVHRENVEDGEPVIAAIIRGTDKIYRFPVDQWKIIELFDGIRSYEDVAEAHAERHGVLYGAEDLREFAEGLDELDFWFKTPFERNAALREKLEANRHQHSHTKSKWGDVSHIQFSAWDPDQYFTKIYPQLKWIYTRWFSMLTLSMFGFMLLLFAANWTQISHDTVQFYTFTEKSAGDLAQFWLLFLVLGFLHESAHGLTCKHYGAEVHAMGFHLIYLTPAFFVDVSEAWVYASRWQRFITILAGVWSEMIVCSIATFIWWGTPAGSDAHDWAYKIMLLTGVAVVVVNMNPLIKLDGYYAFSEIIGFSDIKEKSTVYLSGLVRTRIFRLPVDVEFVPKRRRFGYLLYAGLSGVYSYSLLYTVIRFCHNVLHSFSEEWAFVPTIALGFFIFQTRIRTLVRFLQTVYLDKKDRVRGGATVPRMVLVWSVLLVILLVPVMHETVTARFVLEPGVRAVVRTVVPGRVTAVLVAEGEMVAAGAPLVEMTNTHLESAAAGAEEQLVLAGMRRFGAQLNHEDLSSVVQEHRSAGEQRRIVAEETAQLRPRATIGGTVLSARLGDLRGSYLGAGATIAEIGDLRQMRVKMYVAEFAAPRVRTGAPIALLMDGRFKGMESRVEGMRLEPQEMAAAVETVTKIKGDGVLNYYIADATVANDGSLRDGMTGTAKILVRRRSLAGLIGQEARDFFERKIW